jgi:2-C-methyl-D-erythritol 2,4-cyclodiphosphate synthase
MAELRVGLGFDIHQFVRGRELWLGGVQIPHEEGLDGHSDADALLHALCDALLGAAGLGDIGHYFPPSDPQWRNTRSIKFVEQVVGRLNERGWTVVNVDCVIITEAPKIAPHVANMRVAIGQALQIPSEKIGIKATTAEQMGALGRREGIACQVVCLLSRPDQTEKQRT